MASWTDSSTAEASSPSFGAPKSDSFRLAIVQPTARLSIRVRPTEGPAANSGITLLPSKDMDGCAKQNTWASLDIHTL